MSYSAGISSSLRISSVRQRLPVRGPRSMLSRSPPPPIAHRRVFRRPPCEVRKNDPVSARVGKILIRREAELGSLDSPVGRPARRDMQVPGDIDFSLPVEHEACSLCDAAERASRMPVWAHDEEKALRRL